MTAPMLAPPPAWRAVLAEQARAVGLHLRVVGIFVASVMLLLGALALRLAWMLRATHAAHPKLAGLNITYAPQACRILAGMALLLPLIVWQDEDPTRRAYHWAMPVSRPLHAATKVLAGWLWLMVATVSLLLFWVLTTRLVERISGMPQRYDAGFTWWEWLVTPAAVTVAYLFASAAAVGTRRPFVWIFGIPILYAGAAFLFLAFGMPQLTHSMGSLYGGFVGAEAALAGGVDALNASTGFAAPSLARWLGASVLWGGAGMLLLLGVARRRS